MTDLSLTVIAGALLALLFEYVPGLNSWYDTLDEQRKRLIMLVLVVLAGLGIFGLSCGNTPWQYVECSVDGFWEVVGAIAVAIAANQGVHRLTKKSEA